MKVINIDEEYIFGGPERRIINVAFELKKFGIETIVFMPLSQDKTFFKFAKKNKIKAIELSLSPLSLNRKRLKKYIFGFFYEIILIMNKIKKFKPDLVHINGAYQFKSAIASKLTGTKTIWHVNNTYANPLVFTAFQLISFFCADGYIAASEKAKNYFLSFWWHKTKSTFVIQAPIKRSEYPKRKSYRNKSLSIGTISGFNAQKNPLLFAKTASLIANKYPNINFYIAGHIPKEKNKYLDAFNKELRHSNVKIKKLGFVKNIPLFLSKLDIFLYASSWEGSPTALWEAMASSLAIVTTNVGSASEFVGENLKSGIIINQHNPEELFKAVKKLIKDANLRTNYGSNASRIAKMNFSTQKVAEAHKIAYENFLK